MQFEQSKVLVNTPELFRIQMTTSCKDSNPIPKAPNAGKVFLENGERIQLMHNGVKVIADGYGGKWMTKIIEGLQGCHEPQEEWVYFNIIKRLKVDSFSPKVMELGAFWSYYTLWLLHEIEQTEAYLVEPDPNNLLIGKKNFSLNNRQGNFLQAAIGEFSESYQPFVCEDGITRQLPIENLPSLFRRFCLDQLDLLLLDIQGGEADLIKSGEELFKAGKIRFILVSTHHHSISKDALTHQKCLDYLTAFGAHIIAEHSVIESYSGDGLIAASFSNKDCDLTVPISYARAKESLFGELNSDLATLLNENKLLNNRLKSDAMEIENLKARLPDFSLTFFDLWYKGLRGIWVAFRRSIRGLLKCMK